MGNCQWWSMARTETLPDSDYLSLLSELFQFCMSDNLSFLSEGGYICRYFSPQNTPEKPLFAKINARANSFTFDTHSGRPCILQCKVKYMLGQFNGPRSSWIEGSARSLNHCIVGTFQTNVICCLLRMPREKILQSSAAWLESKVGTLFL